jgi:hypothetical protein
VNKKKKSYLGVTGGFNYSIPRITDSYSVLTSLGSDDAFSKDYGKFGKNNGAQFGIRYQYNFSNLVSIIGGFGYQTNSFNYSTQYSWSDTLENQSFNREMHHLQKISYFTIPVLARWDLTDSQLKPFVQGGFFMGFRHQANKMVTYDNTLDGELTENETSSSALVSITDNINKFNFGLMGGVGINYYTKYVTFGVESNMRFGFINVVNDENRYADANGFALKYLDVLDQLKLNQIDIQFSVYVPISNSVTANIMRKKRYKRK